MNVTDLTLKLDAFSNGGPVIATKSEPIHPYRDGHTVTDETTGQKVAVVFPGNNFQTQDVKVSDPTDRLSAALARATYAAPVYVDFDNFAAKVYVITDRTTGRTTVGLSAKATAVRIVPAPVSDDDLEIAIE